MIVMPYDYYLIGWFYVKVRKAYDHLSNRGPNIAPATVQSTIMPPYHTATNGNESSAQ
jgi:hypothetical protein